MTSYYAVKWHHELAAEPVEILSEVSDSGIETRKIERYRDGRVGTADASHETGSTMLSEIRFPSLEEINSHLEFSACRMSGAEFEALWQAVHQPS